MIGDHGRPAGRRARLMLAHLDLTFTWPWRATCRAGGNVLIGYALRQDGRDTVCRKTGDMCPLVMRACESSRFGTQIMTGSVNRIGTDSRSPALGPPLKATGSVGDCLRGAIAQPDDLASLIRLRHAAPPKDIAHCHKALTIRQ